jgi:hypothetical protein
MDKERYNGHLYLPPIVNALQMYFMSVVHTQPSQITPRD